MEFNSPLPWQSGGQSNQDLNISPEDNERKFVIASDNDTESSLLTPERKQSLENGVYLVDSMEPFLSSGDGSIGISSKDGSALLSSSSSSDSESDSYINSGKTYSIRYHGDEILQKNATRQKDDVTYDELLQKVANYEKELLGAKKQLLLSQEEIERLNFKNTGLEERLRSCEAGRAKLEWKLRNEIRELESQLQSQLDLAHKKNTMFQVELAAEKRLVSELRNTIDKYTNDLADRDRALEKFSKERVQLEASISILSEQKNVLQERLEEAESKNKLLEDEIRQLGASISVLSEQKNVLQGRVEEAESVNTMLEDEIRQRRAEMREMTNLHETRETLLQGEIERLKTEHTQRCEVVDDLNKKLDATKLKYDMLMAEKDEAIAKLQSVRAEVNSIDIAMHQMKENLSQVIKERGEVCAESETLKELVAKLESEVVELEKKVKGQKVVISDRDEEKREAIRQLCLSLEYYRKGYHEFRLALTGKTQRSVSAS